MRQAGRLLLGPPDGAFLGGPAWLTLQSQQMLSWKGTHVDGAGQSTGARIAQVAFGAVRPASCGAVLELGAGLEGHGSCQAVCFFLKACCLLVFIICTNVIIAKQVCRLG